MASTPASPGRAEVVSDRWAALAGLAAASAAAWWYTVDMARSGACFHSGELDCLCPWRLSDAAAALAMWTIMMAAMMLPTLGPLTVALAGASRARPGERPLLSVGAFTAGYLAVWTLFSAGATAAQWGLHAAALLAPATLRTGPALGGALFLAAGAFQWTEWKDACMNHCRSPLGFLLTYWRDGRLGAAWMGARFGIFCVGCCWALMTLSFAMGVMNLVWMAIVTALMVAEKAVPGGRWLSRSAGAAMIGWGAVLIACAGAGAA